ncbi:MAG: thioredoxin domain-containing protein [Patescibacteria group bacterium]|jgi:protein-disulfide isomerase
MGLEERVKYAAMKARHKKLLLPWYKKWWGIVIMVLAGLLLIILTISSLYVISKAKEIIAGQNQGVTEQDYKIYAQNIKGDGTNFFIGTTTPQATIVEFGDFACPYSKESYLAIKQVLADYPDKIKIVWRDYLRNEDSIDLAVAARCAGAQGKFWEMHDKLFEDQENLTTADEARLNRLVALAVSLGMNDTEFATCLTNRDDLAKIQKDYEDGNTLAIIGTPTWFVNNYPISGALTLDKFKELLSGIIK